MNKTLKILGHLFDLVLIMGAVLVYLYIDPFNLHKGLAEDMEPKIQYDTIQYFDTIRYYKPVPKDTLIVRYITEKLPVAQNIEEDSAYCAAFYRLFDDADYEYWNDVYMERDSVEVEIPITQNEYVTDEYRAWVSGFHPSLDSIQIFTPQTVVTKTITQKMFNDPKPKKWGLGIQAGLGTTFGNNTHTTTPYIGIGVSYNIISW